MYKQDRERAGGQNDIREWIIDGGVILKKTVVDKEIDGLNKGVRYK